MCRRVSQAAIQAKRPQFFSSSLAATILRTHAPTHASSAHPWSLPVPGRQICPACPHQNTYSYIKHFSARPLVIFRRKREYSQSFGHLLVVPRFCSSAAPHYPAVASPLAVEPLKSPLTIHNRRPHHHVWWRTPTCLSCFESGQERHPPRTVSSRLVFRRTFTRDGRLQLSASQSS